MADVTVDGQSGQVVGYLAVPGGSGPWPGVVVVHDVLGMSQDLRNQADWLASEGFLAIAPDLFHGRGPVVCMVSIMRQMRARQGRCFNDIDSVRSWLLARDDCTDKVGVIGFCMGAGLALLVAPNHGFNASSVNYGTAPKDAYTADFLHHSCPIVASFGGQDRNLPGAAARLEGALTEVGVDHDVKEYPEAGHALLNDHDRAGDKNPLFFSIMAKLVPGVSDYHEPSAQDARRRIVAFFKGHLTPQAPAL